MLASITPLGQRSRHSSWGVTVTAFVAASTATGGALGAAAGWLGALSGGGHGQLRVWLLAGALAAGLLLDAGVRGLRPPSPRRQVNEDWMYEYRGWVYGAGFGAQLGLGVATIVSTAAVYVTFAAALLSGGALTGALVGACFGLVRGASILAGARVRTHDELRRLHLGLQRWRAPARATGLVLQAALLAWALAAAGGAT